MTIFQIQRYSLSLLGPQAKRKYFLGLFLQAALSILDILGIALAGLVGVLISNPEYGTSNFFFSKYISRNGLNSGSNIEILIILAILTLIFFILKAALALFFTKKIFNFISHQQVIFSQSVLKQLMSTKYSWLRLQDSHSVSTSVVLGSTALITNSLGQFLLLGAEITFMFLFGIVLILINPFVAICAFLYFYVVMSLIRRFVGNKVETYNNELSSLQIQNHSLLFDSIKLTRELRILNRLDNFRDSLEELASQRSLSFSKDMWIQQIPKYALEVAMLLGVVVLVTSGSFFTDSKNLIPVLIVYFTAASRIIPSLLRIQAAVFSLQSKKFYAEMALELSQTIRKEQYANNIKDIPSQNSSRFPDLDQKSKDIFIKLIDVSFNYELDSKAALSNINLEIRQGERIAILGPSGSGKSTLCDVVLGLLVPNNGQVTAHDMTISNWISANPGRIAYLPQDVTIINGTLLQNVCLGLNSTEIDIPAVERALKSCSLYEFVESLPEGFFTILGPNGIRLSGGQKQRLGLARALYSDPDILILDESTSALDITTESGIMETINGLTAETTILMIAHRLSSIRHFNRVIYLEDGVIKGDGSLQELRGEIEALNTQLILSGL